MTLAELFAGWQTFDYVRDAINTVDVELLRRVAGVYAYLKDIPVSSGSQTVKTIRLLSGNRPNTSIALQSRGRDTDFGTAPTSDDALRVLASVNLDDIAVPDAAKRWYMQKDEEGNPTKPLTVLLSAYLLPMQAVTDVNTFSIDLLDDGGAPIKTFPTIWSEAPGAENDKQRQEYPVFANYLYHVGTLGADTDQPASLAGERLELKAVSWKELPVSTVFPKVPLNASIDYGKNASTYIYDCIDTTDVIHVMPSLINKPWKLTIVNMDNTECDWLYFLLDDNTCTQEVESTEETRVSGQEIRIWMNDHVVQHSYFVEKAGKVSAHYEYEAGYNPNVEDDRTNINNDVRRAKIVLKTEGSSAVVAIPIRQYNAITVVGMYEYVGHEEPFTCGVSRFDNGALRDKDGKVIAGEGGAKGKFTWGFWATTFLDIYGVYNFGNVDNKPCYDGEVSYTAAENKGNRGFSGSLIQTTRRESTAWTGTAFANSTHFWYLTSQWELYEFFRQFVNKPDLETHVEPNELYWSATPSRDAHIAEGEVKSYGQWTNKIEEEASQYRTKDRHTHERNYGFARRARKF